MASKNKLIRILIFGATLLSKNCLAIADKAENEVMTKKAYQYFEDQLNFTTNAAGVKKVVEGKVSNVKIIDVRAEKHFKISRIPSSINIAFDKFGSFEGDEQDFPGLNKQGYNYVLCYEETCNLSQKACRKFASLGYLVKEVKGGFASYKDHNYTVDESKI